ncbi:hypothetical protein SB6412_02637 [Klebsiella pasteurii]|nr:hypothetical protein SB6412_02637 [Klebsiella pasteurii]
MCRDNIVNLFISLKVKVKKFMENTSYVLSFLTGGAVFSMVIFLFSFKSFDADVFSAMISFTGLLLALYSANRWLKAKANEKVVSHLMGAIDDIQNEITRIMYNNEVFKNLLNRYLVEGQKANNIIDKMDEFKKDLNDTIIRLKLLRLKLNFCEFWGGESKSLILDLEVIIDLLDSYCITRNNHAILLLQGNVNKAKAENFEKFIVLIRHELEKMISGGYRYYLKLMN